MNKAPQIMKTLVIDDDLFALKLLARQLDQLGHTGATMCESAKQALPLIESHFETISLVFCDLQMPEMDGVQFVRHLGRVGYRGALVLVSGEDGRIVQTVQKLAQAHQINMLGALSKPVSLEHLRHILDRVAAPHNIAGRRKVQPTYLKDELQRAITGNELVNYYQPKVDFVTGRLVGVETLVRWQHPQSGLVFPDQFIGLAEQYDLMDQLTFAVLSTALHQTRAWKAVGLNLQVSVNVSMDNLATLDFPDQVAQAADAAGVELSNLMLEVTESRLMIDLRTTLDTLTRLRLKRIGLAIDDFGTGHSSLVQLRDVPFDELKLDKSFIHGAGMDSSLKAIVEGTLEMARQLGIKSVAEGVEDLADWDFMRAQGCDIAQGYFIARPMLGGDLPGWNTEWELRSQQLTEGSL